MPSAPVSGSQALPPSAHPDHAPLYRVLICSLLALIAGSGTALWFEKTRYEAFPSYLQARLRTLNTTREARVSRILVEPGTLVGIGQPLVVLEDEALAGRIRDKQHEITSLEIELGRTRAALEVELDIQQRDIRDRVFETRWRSAQAMRQQFLTPQDSPYAGQTAGSWDSALPPVAHPGARPALIFGNGLRQVPERPSQDAATAGLQKVALAEMELCTEHIRELEKMSRELPEKIGRSIGIDLVEARLAHAQAALADLAIEQKELTLVADSPGMVGVFQKDVGDYVRPHEAIVQILDEEQPFLLLKIPSPRVSDFSPGTVVELRFPGGHKGKGRVEEIPPQTSSLPDGETLGKDTVITAHIDRVGALWPELPFGSVVEVRRKR